MKKESQYNLFQLAMLRLRKANMNQVDSKSGYMYNLNEELHLVHRFFKISSRTDSISTFFHCSIYYGCRLGHSAHLSILDTCSEMNRPPTKSIDRNFEVQKIRPKLQVRK